ncbi:MAG: MFS transporter [Pseudomonadota bacterium]|nr:MFS transporter [Pseudomonadota bacterium]
MTKKNRSGHEIWKAVALLWLAGNGLRLTILAIPPVIARIQHEFALSATQVGLLSSIPPALFAIAALGGSLLVSRLGLRAALVGGLALVAAGSALRGWSASYDVLLATTVVMSIGVAILQPIMPTTVRQWLPQRIGLGTAIYTNGLLMGEVFPVLLTVPFVLPLLHQSWRASLVFWSLPVAIIALVVYVVRPDDVSPIPASNTARKWLPDWRTGLVWRLGGLFLCVNSMYFGANAFIPIYLTSAGRSDLVSAALLALNFGQLPASGLLLLVAAKLERRTWPYVAFGVLSLMSIAGLVAMPGLAAVWWAGLLGFAAGGTLILGLTLPPLLCHPEDVARTAAGMFTISYSGAVVIAIVSGAAWDVSGIPAFSFFPLGACAVALVGVSVLMRRNGELR